MAGGHSLLKLHSLEKAPVLILKYLQICSWECNVTLLIKNRNDMKCSLCIVWHCLYWFQTSAYVSEFDGAIIDNVYWSEVSVIT